MFKLFIMTQVLEKCRKEVDPNLQKGRSERSRELQDAVGGTVYRLYANLLRSLIQDVVNTQNPGQNLASILAVVHCNPSSSCGNCGMQLKMCSWDHHACSLLSLTSSKHMIPFQGASCGNIYNAARCHTKFLPS